MTARNECQTKCRGTSNHEQRSEVRVKAGWSLVSLFLVRVPCSIIDLVAASTTLNSADRREIYLDRRVMLVTPGRIDVHPARSIVFLPLITLFLGLAIFPLIFFYGDSFSIPIRLLLTLAAIVVVPLSGLGVVYSIAGAHLVIDAAKQSAVLQQGYLGLGVGTQELVPFWKIDKIVVQELTPHDYRGHHEDFVQYEIYILKLSGRQVNVGMVTTARVDAKDAFERAREVADLIAEMSGTKVHVPKVKRGLSREELIARHQAAQSQEPAAEE